MQIQGKIIDILNRRIYKGELTVKEGKIIAITEKDHAIDTYLLPGFIDAHIHIESAMLVPSEFARLAVLHGSVATVSDPHEIANVLGVPGVEFMIENGKKVPFKFNFGAPSCVPATAFETAGAVIDSEDIKKLLASDDIKYLTEMMNYPGVLFKDEEVLKKIAWAKHYNKPVDGHAPGLRGDKAKQYIDAGITTDHECFTYEEAAEKLSYGMKIIIREGSAAKNFDALINLLPENYKNMMFCSDDKHPDDLIVGHINKLVARAIALDMDLYNVLQAACLNPIDHYNLDVGELKVGDPADFIEIDNTRDFNVLRTFIDGQCVAENGVSNIEPVAFDTPNNFNTSKKQINDFKIVGNKPLIRVIEAIDKELITNQIITNAKLKDDCYIADIDNDILKITVVNRYHNEEPALAFIKNFGLKEGAIASSVAHDCHNIVAVGTSDEHICNAVNALIAAKGGVCAVSDTETKLLALPVAGIMSDKDGWETGKLYEEIDAMAKTLGCTLTAPFMTLSFMALLVIPSLKLSNKGLFDGTNFEFTAVGVDD